jgi:Transglutaminase-like superfamily
MRNKVIFVLLGALLLQCCCLGSMTPQLDGLVAEFEQQLTMEIPVEVQPTIAMETPAPVEPPTPTEPLLNLTSDPVVGKMTYTVQETLLIANEGSGTVDEVKLHMALLRDWTPYQDATLIQASPSDYEIITDAYDNKYALFWFYDMQPGESVPITIEYEVTVNALDYDLSVCSGETFNAFTHSEKYLEVDHVEISTLAEFLTEDAETDCQAVNNIYTYVIDAMGYVGYVPGDNGALQAHQTGTGDCTDYADLMIALTRAAGIPARFVEGVTYGADGYYDEGQTKHDWLEVYLPGSGWVPMDPTWGESDAATYFAGVSPDHIVLSKGRNLSTLNGYHYWAYWWWGDDDAKVNAYDEAWKIWKK